MTPDDFEAQGGLWVHTHVSLSLLDRLRVLLLGRLTVRVELEFPHDNLDPHRSWTTVEVPRVLPRRRQMALAQEAPVLPSGPGPRGGAPKSRPTRSASFAPVSARASCSRPCPRACG